MADLTYEQRLKMLKAALGICDECWPDFMRFAANQGSGDIFEKVRQVVWGWWGEWPHGLGCPQKPQQSKKPRPADRPEALAESQDRATMGGEQPPSSDPSKTGREVVTDDPTPQS